MYVAYYYPSLRHGQGYIYLPGEGPIWRLNVSTIVRVGRDGRWNYVSPEWEALVKPFLVRAQAAKT